MGRLDPVWSYKSDEPPAEEPRYRMVVRDPRFRVSTDRNATIIAAMSESGLIVVFNSRGDVLWEEKTRFESENYPMAGGISVSPNGQYVAAGSTPPRLYSSNGTLRYAATEPPLEGTVESVSVDNSGRTAVALSEGTLCVLDRQGNMLLDLQLKKLVPDGNMFRSAGANSVAWSGNGRYILTTLDSGAIIGTPAAGQLDHEWLLILDDEGSLVWSRPIHGLIVDASVSDDGRVVAATNTCFSHPTLAPWNKYVATCGLRGFSTDDDAEWLFQMDAPGGFFQGYHRYLPASLSADGMMFVTASAREILMFDSRGSLLLRWLSLNASYVSLSDGYLAVGGPRFVSLWSTSVAALNKGYTVSVSPAMVELTPGGSANVTVTLASVSGFSGSVWLTWTRPQGVFLNGDFSADKVTLAPNGKAQSEFVLTIPADIPAGSYNVVLTAQIPGTSVSKSTSLTVIVTPQSGTTTNTAITESAVTVYPFFIALAALTIGGIVAFVAAKRRR